MSACNSMVYCKHDKLCNEIACTGCVHHQLCISMLCCGFLGAPGRCVACSEKGSVAEWLGEGGRKMAQSDMEAPDLVYVRTMTYDLDCNWKVFNDNYLVRICCRLPRTP